MTGPRGSMGCPRASSSSAAKPPFKPACWNSRAHGVSPLCPAFPGRLPEHISSKTLPRNTSTLQAQGSGKQRKTTEKKSRKGKNKTTTANITDAVDSAPKRSVRLEILFLLIHNSNELCYPVSQLREYQFRKLGSGEKNAHSKQE